MVRSIDVQSSSCDLRELARVVEQEKDQILLRKGDTLVAVVIPASQEPWTGEEKANARRQFFEMVDEIRTRTEGLDRDTVQRLVRRGVKAVRHAKHHH